MPDINALFCLGKTASKMSRDVLQVSHHSRSQVVAFNNRDRSLITVSEAEGCLLVARGLMPPNELSSDVLYEDVTTLNLTFFPCFPIHRLELSPNGRFLALVGDVAGLAVVRLPKQLFLPRTGSPDQSASEEYLCICELLEPAPLTVLKALWHPGSLDDRHLLLLTTENTLLIYDAMAPQRPIQRISVVNSFSSEWSLSGARSFLGETAVSLDFGAARSLSPDGSDIVWPVFVLYGTGELFRVLTDVQHFRVFAVQGPLTMFPPTEDNYGVESNDLICLSSGSLPVLVISSAYGILYHCVLLDEEAEENAAEMVYVYERLELEFSLTTVDLKTGGQKEDSDQLSPVTLYKDPLYPSRYYCSHTAGVHAVSLPWFHELSRAFLADSSRIPSSGAAKVQYLVCTQPVSDSEQGGSEAGVRGLVIVHSSPTSYLLSLLSDSSIQAFPIHAFGYELERVGGEAEVNPRLTDYFIDEIKRILRKSSSVPLMRSKKKAIGEKEAAEQLFRAMEVLSKEYVQRLASARQTCDARVFTLSAQYEHQSKLLGSAQKRLKGNLAVCEKLSSRIQQIRTRQNWLNERLRQLADRNYSYSVSHWGLGVVSSAESRLLENLRLLSRGLNALNVRVAQLNVALKADRSPPDSHRPETLRFGPLFQQLTRQHRDLEGLVEAVNSISRHLNGVTS